MKPLLLTSFIAFTLFIAPSAFTATGNTNHPSANSYAGVIREGGSDDHWHAGSFRARVGAGGAFSARVSWQGFGYALGGALDAGGTFDRTVHKVGGGKFAVHLDAAAVLGRIRVTVTDGAITTGTDARPALYGPATPSPWQPKYNGVVNHYPDLGFLSNTDGRVRVSPDGLVRYIARLGDGSVCSAGSFLVAGDPWTFPDSTVRVIGDKFPVYSKLYRKATRGSAWGDGEVIDLRLVRPSTYSPSEMHAATGEFQWHRPAQRNGPAPNTAGQGVIRPFLPEYHAPSPGEPVVPLAQPPLPPGQLFLQGGGLAGAIVVPLGWTPAQQFVAGPNVNAVRLSTNASEGTFKGTFRHPVTERTVRFSGVYRPGAGAIGTFRGPDNVGSVEILGLD